ncbi:type I pullulanase [Clostridium taeniosporum]|uniref:pullulanase n=1 Tax=Clostridium taeniosporum TaxID=394958 RepID=A0A2I6SDG9_9CLOT|nr:type I pullulanase [Clostridium taeniosporum]AUO15617.1 type I pullulanase [Clostridium taeniosporum]
MKKLKKIWSIIFVVTFIFTMAQIPPVKVKAADDNDGVYVKIRYDRLDKNYDDWDIWTWEKGKDGKSVNFIGEDNEGKFAVIKINKNKKQLFFIIRKSDWSDKATDDECVDLTNGDKEVIIHENNKKITREDRKLNRNFNKVKLNLHYYRSDNNYDSWNAWCWFNENDGQGYKFNKQDEFGKIAEINKLNTKNDRKISFIIRKGKWKEKDIDKDRAIDLAYANNDGEINAYIAEDDENVYMDNNKSIGKKITSLKIDSINEIKFETNSKIDNTDEFILKNNGNVSEKDLYNITLEDNRMKGCIKFNKKLNLNNTYSLEIPKFGTRNADFRKVYDSSEFEDLYSYRGNLGAIYSKEGTQFKLWAPTATDVKVVLYGKDGKQADSKSERKLNMTKENNGVWTVKESEDLDGVYYNYLVTINGEENEVIDPYAKAVGVNGNRGMVVNLESTNPKGWENDKRPELKNPTDAVIYEMHIRDFSIDPNSGVDLKYRGKFKGVWQNNTSNLNGNIKTGVAHLKELGVNTVQLMPSFDYGSVDESRLNVQQFNWGYDPKNYNVPEGSYSTDPYNGKIRIKEFKEMINELHKQGIRVVMDVVYNHTYTTKNSNFNLAVPDYYYRQDKDGNYSNGSGCGNETASNRPMVRKFILDSVKYWVKEYHIDGFRFDLMANHDIETMKLIRKELDKIDDSILVYGEGWAGGPCALKNEDQSLKINVSKFGDRQIGVFSDDIRDGLKGDVFNKTAPAFINGTSGFEDWVKFGIVGSTKHDGIDYNKVRYSKKPWANEPYQTINYVSCHDDLTLWDRMNIVNPNKSDEELKDMNKMAAAVIFTSQGIPFIQAGEEFARTKVNKDGTFNENSYNSPDSVNKLDWNRIEKYKDLYKYYQGLINLRNSHKAFRMNKATDIQNNLKFLETNKNNLIAYTINGKAVGDKWGTVAVIFNSNKEPVKITLPKDKWTIVVNKDKAGVENLGKIEGNKVTIPGNTSYVLVDTESYEKNYK